MKNREGRGGPKVLISGLIILSACTASVSTGGGNSKVASAAQVSDCMRLHSMAHPSVLETNPEGVSHPFLEADPNVYANSSDAIYQHQSPTVYREQSCFWPPQEGADQTGYSEIVVVTVPGSQEWQGEVRATAFADVIDTSCSAVAAEYSGGHAVMGNGNPLFTHDVTVASGDIAITSTQIPGDKAPSNLSAWAQSLAYFWVKAPESVILHAADESLHAIRCA